MQDPNTFKPIQTLSCNVTEKRVVLLGTVVGKQGEAIMIINAKTPNEKYCEFKDVKQVFQNDIYSRFDVRIEGEYQLQAIFPVTDKHKNKYSEKRMIADKETAQKYNKTKDELLKKQLAHNGWIKNIIQGKAEVQRVLFRNGDYIILPDFKFSNLEEVQTLHLLVIFIDPELHSIRDLRGSHLKMLSQCQKDVNRVLAQKFKLEQGSCRMFFHYPPTFYQLHLHITNLRSQAVNSSAERAHLLQNVMSNLEYDSEYYKKVTLLTVMESNISK